MKLVLFCNYLNHHQVRVADELYGLLGEEFRFVTTMPFNVGELKGGEDFSRRPYCINACDSEANRQLAEELAINARVCLFGAASQQFAVLRARNNPRGLSLEISERWLKRGLVNMLSPRFIEWYRNYIRYYRKARFYKLCSSSYVTHDDNVIHCYKYKHFKWGYFTEVPDIDIDQVIDARKGTSTVKILWVARFLQLKHPFRMLQLCRRLKADGILNFEITMIGNGPVYDKVNAAVERLGLSSHIKLLGALPNSVVLEHMRGSDIFCFTSDRNEGWGAVANEAMSNGCVLVASEDIGSAPYLISNGVNGFMFKTHSDKDLSDKVAWLIKHPEERNKMRRNAYKTIALTWSPANAALSLLQLIDDLLNGREASIAEGPCSKA